jgi:hypothetical protein
MPWSTPSRLAVGTACRWWCCRRAITRTYTRAFFDLHLRGEPHPLLEQPSTSYPEVAFHG